MYMVPLVKKNFTSNFGISLVDRYGAKALLRVGLLDYPDV